MHFLIFNIVVALALSYLIFESNPVSEIKNHLSHYANAADENRDTNSLEQPTTDTPLSTLIVSKESDEKISNTSSSSPDVLDKISDNPLPLTARKEELKSSDPISMVKNSSETIEGYADVQSFEEYEKETKPTNTNATVDLMTPNQRSDELSKLIDKLQLFAINKLHD